MLPAATEEVDAAKASSEARCMLLDAYLDELEDEGAGEAVAGWDVGKMGHKLRSELNELGVPDAWW